MVVMPDTGRMGIHDANRMSSIMPVQNAGAEKPIRATMVTRWLVQLFGRRPACTPRQTPMRTAAHTAVTTSSSVAGRRS